MYLSESDVRAIATNMHIWLTDEELTRMTSDLNDLIESLAPITEYDLQGVDPTYHPIPGFSNIMREDVTKPGLTFEEAFTHAPAQQDGQFLIPQILGADSGR